MSDSQADDDFISEFLAEAGVADDPIVTAALEDADEHVRLIEKLVAVREDRGLRQTDIAERMGTTQSRVSNIERIGGDPRISTVMRYGRAVGLRVRFVTVASGDHGWKNVGPVEVRPLAPVAAGRSARGWKNVEAAETSVG